ncbi:MAG: LysR family transcriptional regulator [Usitatibacter sp.]
MTTTPPPLVDLRLLRVFLAVSETGSMTAAAQQLGLTQSAISQSLRQLEAEFNVSLFARDRRPLQLTPAGNALRERAARLVEDANHLPSLLQEIGGSLPVIRIGLVDSFAATVGPHLIRDLLRETLHLSVYSGLSPSHGEALQRRAVDLAVTSDSLDDIDGLERHLLLQEPFLLVVPTDYAEDTAGLTLDQIAARYPMVRYSARSHLGTQVERHLRRLGIVAPRTVEMDTSDTLVAMVAAGCGWAITTPLCYLQGRAHAERALPMRLPGPGFTRSLVLIARSGEYAELPRKVASHAHRILVSAVIPEIRRMIPWIGSELAVGNTSSTREIPPPQ